MVLAMCGALTAALGVWIAISWRHAGPAERVYSSALDAARRGDSGTAMSALQSAVMLQPSNGDYHADLGVLYLQRGDASRAVPELQAAAYLAPEHPHVYCRLAQALVEEHRRADALDAVAAALRKTPDCPIALSVRGEQLLRDDNLSGALADFERVIRLDPGSALAYEKIGYIHLSTQKPDEAMAVLLKGLANNPNHPGLHALLGTAYAKHPDDPHSAALAEQHLRLAFAGNPDAASVHTTLGELYLSTKRASEAGAQFQEALRLSPYRKEALYGMAEVLRRAGKAAESRRYLATFQRIQVWSRQMNELQAQAAAHPEDLESRLKIARMQMDKNIDKEALRTLDEATAIDPARRVTRELRAEVYRRLGQHEKAAAESAVADRLPVLASR